MVVAVLTTNIFQDPCIQTAFNVLENDNQSPAVIMMCGVAKTTENALSYVL